MSAASSAFAPIHSPPGYRLGPAFRRLGAGDCVPDCGLRPGHAQHHGAVDSCHAPAAHHPVHAGVCLCGSHAAVVGLGCLAPTPAQTPDQPPPHGWACAAGDGHLPSADYGVRQPATAAAASVAVWHAPINTRTKKSCPRWLHQRGQLFLMGMAKACSPPHGVHTARLRQTFAPGIACGVSPHPMPESAAHRPSTTVAGAPLHGPRPAAAPGAAHG